MDPVMMRGFMTLTRIDEALSLFFSKVDIARRPGERIPIAQALDRVLAEDVIAAVDVPDFDRAAVDGYAVKAEDTYGASSANPLVLDVVGTVEIGTPSKAILGRQQAMWIATGAAIPDGADAVVMVEYSEKISEERVEIHSSLTPWENVSRRGEDVQKGEKILLKGASLQPQDLGILAALGYNEVEIVEKPHIAVLSTGNELVAAGDTVEKGRVIDSNRPILTAMVESLGGEAIDLGIARDDFEEIRSRIISGLERSDIVLVSGGTSVGKGDLAPEIIGGIGKPGIIVHGLSMRPGRPTALAAADGKPIVLLPGFPVAAMISFDAVVKPIILRMLGASVDQFWGRVVRARMLRRVPSSIGNRTFARVIVTRVGGGFVAEPLRTSGSGVISSMIRANGLIVIPENKEGFEEGEEVEVTLLRPI